MKIIDNGDGTKSIDYTENIRRGAALLDKHNPGWEFLIDPDTLALESVSSCVLGQLWMKRFNEMDGFQHMLEELSGSSSDYIDPGYYGFDCYLSDDECREIEAEAKKTGSEVKFPDETGFSVMEEFEMLTYQWVAEIQLRLAVHNAIHAKVWYDQEFVGV